MVSPCGSPERPTPASASPSDIEKSDPTYKSLGLPHASLPKRPNFSGIPFDPRRNHFAYQHPLTVEQPPSNSLPIPLKEMRHQMPDTAIPSKFNSHKKAIPRKRPASLELPGSMEKKLSPAKSRSSGGQTSHQISNEIQVSELSRRNHELTPSSSLAQKLEAVPALQSQVRKSVHKPITRTNNSALVDYSSGSSTPEPVDLIRTSPERVGGIVSLHSDANHATFDPIKAHGSIEDIEVTTATGLTDGKNYHVEPLLLPCKTANRTGAAITLASDEYTVTSEQATRPLSTTGASFSSASALAEPLLDPETQGQAQNNRIKQIQETDGDENGSPNQSSRKDEGLVGSPQNYRLQNGHLDVMTHQEWNDVMAEIENMD